LPLLPGHGRFEVIDLRPFAPAIPPPDLAGHFKPGGAQRPLVRRPEAVLGVGLHQTACIFRVGEAAVRAAGGDPVRAKTLRARNVAAPVVCFLEPPGPPRIVVSWPLLWHMNHGNALNPFTIGLEVEAKLPGQMRQRGWALNADQHACIEQAIRVVVELGRAEGCPMTHIWAHRQTNGKKPGDPGEEIWTVGVVEYARPVLGLTTELDRFWRGSTIVTPAGRPIPRVWDPQAKAEYQ